MPCGGHGVVGGAVRGAAGPAQESFARFARPAFVGQSLSLTIETNAAQFWPEPGPPSAVRHTRTVSLPLMVTGVPSGSAPATTASTPAVWPVMT